MTFDMTSLVVGVILGALFTTAIVYQRVGRILTRVVAVVLITAGVGLLGWVIGALLRGDELTAIVWRSVTLSQPSEVIGWGAGLLLGGTTALILSFLGRRD